MPYVSGTEKNRQKEWSLDMYVRCAMSERTGQKPQMQS
jgi:hypothetical protein